MNERRPGQWRTMPERLQALCEAGATKKRLMGGEDRDPISFDVRHQSERYANITLVEDHSMHPEAAMISAISRERVLDELRIGGLKSYGSHIIDITISPDGIPRVMVVTEARGSDDIWQELSTTSLSMRDVEQNQELLEEIRHIGTLILAIEQKDIISEV